MFKCSINKTDWEAGFQAGQKGKPNTPPPDVDGMAWSSGYVEGSAAREETAYHEAGHAVITYRSKHYMKNTSIIGKGDIWGESIAEEPDPEIPESRERSREYIIALYAGYEAQRKYNSNADIAGSSDDNEKAAYHLQFHPGETESSLRQEAREMVTADWNIVEAVSTMLMQENELNADDVGYIVDLIDEGEDWKTGLKNYRLRKEEIQKKYDDETLENIESEIQEIHLSQIKELMSIRTTSRHKENPLYAKSSFERYLMGEFNMSLETLLETNAAYDKYPEECIRYGVGTIVEIMKKCGPVAQRKVMEDIKAAEDSLENKV